jgi:hypothetical protein
LAELIGAVIKDNVHGSGQIHACARWNINDVAAPFRYTLAERRVLRAKDVKGSLRVAILKEAIGPLD